MTYPKYQETKQYEADYKRIPISQTIHADIVTPITLLRKVAAGYNRFYLLESMEDETKRGRYSFIGFDPVFRLFSKDGKTIKETNEKSEQIFGEPLDILRTHLMDYQAPKIEQLPTFCGGFVGYFSYDLISYVEPTLHMQQSEYNTFDLMLFDQVLAYDHIKQMLIIIVNYEASKGEEGYLKAEEDIAQLLKIIKQPDVQEEHKAINPPEFTCNHTKEEYIQMVQKTKQYIKDGDIFQAVLSRKFSATYIESLLNAYRILRTTNPSPYMYFIQCDDLQIAGTSPETMVKLTDNLLTTFPVAGTRRRGKDKEEDRQIADDLLADEKECAEHNMLVDLARNDIGRIAKIGTVKVDEYMAIHFFSKVMHIASVVTGELAEGKDQCDVISTMLPAGTLSGAPKIRACEIIEELEQSPRGIYGGAVGYLDLSGNLDVCIAIRTAIKKGNQVSVQAGAGIVADSNPESEYQECANKAGAVIEAIKRASEVINI